MPDIAVQVPPRVPSPSMSYVHRDDSSDYGLEAQPLSVIERRRVFMEEMAARARARHAARPHRYTLGLPWWGWGMAISGICFLLFMGLWGIKRTGPISDYDNRPPGNNSPAVSN